MKKIFNKISGLVLVMSAIMLSCTTKDLDPSLEQNKEGGEAIQTTSDLEGVLKGMYDRMTHFEYYGRDYIVTNEVRTPNTWANGSSGRFVTQGNFAYNNNTIYIWYRAYRVIANANIIINTDITGLEDFADNGDYAAHIQGQAYAIRALAHFDLLKVYGQEHVDASLGVPYLTEFKGDNETPGRDTVEENREMLFSDIREAFDLMSDDFYDSSKGYVNKYAAKAIESRMALWFGMYEQARDAAGAVINSGQYSIVAAGDFVNSFAISAPANSIFELIYNDTDNQGIDGLEYIYRGSSYGDISVAPNAFNDLYEEEDVRTGILGYEGDIMRNMGKYPERESNVGIIRYEEVVLNYAEAKFNLGEADAIDWLNMIPQNRGVADYASITEDNILLERRKEFLFEGLYYWDLQRMKRDIEKIDAEQNISEAIPYGDTRRIHPIPVVEVDANSNMEQNPGY